MAVDRESLLTDPHLAPLWMTIHERLCSGVLPGSLSTLRVKGLSAIGIASLRTWLDTTTRRRRGKSAVETSGDLTSFPVRELLDLLGISPDEIQLVVERALDRPVVNRAILRRAMTARKIDLWTYAAERLPALPGLVARMRIAGVGEDAAELRETVDALAAVVALLPCNPLVTLAKLAHDCAGDPHFLDLDGLPGKRLVTAVAEMIGQSEPTRPDLVRRLLVKVGIVADRLSSTVLLHNVRVRGTGPIDRRLQDADGPVALTLYDLTRHPPLFARQVLTVVENPSVLEAAMATHSTSALAATSGQLGSVDHALLQLARDQDVTLRYSGDLDNNGLHIAAVVASEYGAELVAMDLTTVAEGGSGVSKVVLGELSASHDPALTTAMKTHGHVLFQEHNVVLNRLLRSPDDHDR